MQVTPERLQQVKNNLRYLKLLARDYPSVPAAASEIVNQEAILRLPKGTEHFMSDLHGENEAFFHILNSASGVIKEKVDLVLGPQTPEQERQEFATLIYYPVQKLPVLKAKQTNLEQWYKTTLLRLIELCRFVSSKHTRAYVRALLPASCAHILDELLHAHFEDHNKEMYYAQIIAAIIENERADAFILRFCQLIKRLAVDKLHIVGDLYDRGPRPDLILDALLEHGAVDIQWGNHDVVWMGAAAGSPLCIATVLKTALSYGNIEGIEEGYGLNLRMLGALADQIYAGTDLSLFLPKGEGGQRQGQNSAAAIARMHKAITIIMFKLECQVIDRNPEFRLEGRDFLRRIDYRAGTVNIGGREYPLNSCDFPTVDPADPAALSEGERFVVKGLVASFRQSEKLQRHVRFLYHNGAMYHVENGNLLYHGAVPMTQEGNFAAECFEGRWYQGRALFDYCDRRARQGYFSPEGSPERLRGQDFLWYLWCGRLSPLFGRSAMTTFERLYVADRSTWKEVSNPYYELYQRGDIADKILAEFGLSAAQQDCHIVNGHVPVRVSEGESPIKGGGKLIVIDGGFCRAYHEKTGIAGYTLVYSSHGMSLRTHQPFESTEKAIKQNLDIVSCSMVVDRSANRVLVQDTDEGADHRDLINTLKQLVIAYRYGLLNEAED